MKLSVEMHAANFIREMTSEKSGYLRWLPDTNNYSLTI